MKYLSNVMEQVLKRNPNEPEFHQAVKEVLESLEPVAEKNPQWVQAGIFDRMVEPERQIIFVCLGGRQWQGSGNGLPCPVNSSIGPTRAG